MRKIFIMLMVLFTTITFGQNNNNGNNNNSKEDSFFNIVKPYVEKLAKNVEEGVEFVKEEAPIVIEQYLIFTAIEYWIYVSLGIIVLLIGLGLFLYIGRLNKNNAALDGIKWVPLSFSQLIGWVIIFGHLFIAIKVTWFPKLFLIEKFLNLL